MTLFSLGTLAAAMVVYARLFDIDAAAFLPSSAGSQISTYPTEPFEAPPGVFVPLTLEPLQALLVLAVWAIVPLIVGAVLLKRRDS